MSATHEKGERNAQIAKCYADGYSIRELGIMFELTYERVRQILVRAGVTMRPRGARLTPKQYPL